VNFNLRDLFWLTTCVVFAVSLFLASRKHLKIQSRLAERTSELASLGNENNLLRSRLESVNTKTNAIQNRASEEEMRRRLAMATWLHTTTLLDGLVTDLLNSNDSKTQTIALDHLLAHHDKAPVRGILTYPSNKKILDGLKELVDSDDGLVSTKARLALEKLTPYGSN